MHIFNTHKHMHMHETVLRRRSYIACMLADNCTCDFNSKLCLTTYEYLVHFFGYESFSLGYVCLPLIHITKKVL